MEKSKNNTCDCKSEDDLVITCSGAADLGYLADQVARKLNRNKVCKMSCLALIASCDKEKINDFKSKNILLIEGCAEDCGKKIMQNKNIKNYHYLRLTDLGYEKGKTSTNQIVINEIYQKAKVIF